MLNFKSKFIYPVYIARFLLFLALIVAAVLFVFVGIPSFFKQHSIIKSIGLSTLGFFLFSYMMIMSFLSLKLERYSIVITNEKAYLKDNVFGKKIFLNENFYGYSFSNYSSRHSGIDFRTLIFYFQDGKKIEMPQFLHLNFKEIHPALKGNKIHFLGNEPFKWKNLFRRQYFFET